MVDVVTEFANEGALSEFLYANDFFLMSATFKGLMDKFFKRKESFESKDLKVDLEETMVMVSGGISKRGMSKSKVDP